MPIRQLLLLTEDATLALLKLAMDQHPPAVAGDACHGVAVDASLVVVAADQVIARSGTQVEIVLMAIVAAEAQQEVLVPDIIAVQFVNTQRI